VHSLEKLPAIIVPIYKNFDLLTDEELISLHQLYKVLGGYEIFLAGPENLEYDIFLKDAQKQNVILKVKRFSNEYFNDIKGYNRLLMSPVFYKNFKRFNYMLIYQLDAYVFRDELKYWCNKGYDYIGSPWFADINNWVKIKDAYPGYIKCYHHFFNLSKKKVGNGGFSLRNVSSCLNNLNRFKLFAKNWKGNEDCFFSHCVGILNPFFKIPSFEIALSFGFDADPGKAFFLNGNSLPFGCHAWSRNDGPDYANNHNFWVQYIKKGEELSQ